MRKQIYDAPNENRITVSQPVTWLPLESRFRDFIRAFTLVWVALAGLSSSEASTPNERVVCASADKKAWMTEAQARQIFNAQGYALVKFKLSKGNCYEFYAVEHNGDIVEAYLHPVTGETVRITRIPAASKSQSTSK